MNIYGGQNEISLRDEANRSGGEPPPPKKDDTKKVTLSILQLPSYFFNFICFYLVSGNKVSNVPTIVLREIKLIANLFKKFKI